MVKTFKPLNGKVTVREFDPKAVITAAGIELSKEEHAPAVLYGEIVHVCSFKEDDKNAVKVGDKIAYPVTDGRHIYINNEEFKLLSSDQIIGVYTD
jgi:co-chaperonin GroES (HSP10)